jgi:hypothetical protein
MWTVVRTQVNGEADGLEADKLGVPACGAGQLS